MKRENSKGIVKVLVIACILFTIVEVFVVLLFIGRDSLPQSLNFISNEDNFEEEVVSNSVNINMKEEKEDKKETKPVQFFDGPPNIWEIDEPGKKYYMAERPYRYKYNVSYYNNDGTHCTFPTERKCWREPYSKESYDYYFDQRFSPIGDYNDTIAYKPNPSLSKYVSDYPFITPYTFLGACDHVILNDKYPFQTIKDGDLVGVMSEGHFWSFVIERTKHANIIIYLPPRGDHCSICKNFEKLTNAKHIYAVFTPSFDVMYHPKLLPMFFGFSFSREFNSHNEIANIKKVGTNWHRNKTNSNLIFTSINQNNNRKERIWILEHFKGMPGVVLSRQGYSLEQFTLEVAKAKFVLCPAGNGLGTIRFMQTILTGSFPIVRKSPLDILYKYYDLPVVIVEQWNDITVEFLNKKFDELYGKEYNNLERLYAEYYFKLIRNCKERILQGLIPE